MREWQQEQIYSEMKKHIENGKRKFIIFPFGEYGEYIKQLLNQEFGIKELCVLDNFKKQEGVHTLDYLSKYSNEEDCYLLLATANAHLKQGLINQASVYISESRIVRFFEMEDVPSDEELERERQVRKKDIEAGKRLIDTISAQDKKKFYFFYSGANGDLVAAVSLVHEAKKLHGFAQAVLVCKKRHCEFAEMFDAITECQIVTDEEMNQIMACGRAYERMFGENYILGNFSLLERCWRVHQNRLDELKLCILQIPQNSQPEAVSETFVTTPINELKKRWGKSILIAPYANTFDCLPEVFWEKMVKSFSDMGYQVYCNVFGEEKEIAGTICFEASLKEAFEMTVGAAAVVSNRSGFSDVIAFNKDVCHVVINPSQICAEYDNIEIFGSKNIHNFVWDGTRQEELLEEICQVIK